MSTALAIAGVTAVLRDLLNDGLINHNVSGMLGSTVVVSALPPDRVASSNGPEGTQINIFLHQVTPNAAWRNSGFPSHDGSGRNRLTNPPLALDLHYLISAYGAENLHAEILLGYAMQLLHETPVLSREAIRRALTPSPDLGAQLPPALRALASCGLAEQLELIRVTPATMNSEEVSRIWSALQSNYRPTAAYQASVVLIEASQPTRAALPVLSRGEIDPTSKRERGVQVQSSLLPPLPFIQKVSGSADEAVVKLGDSVTLRGFHLEGSGHEVILENDRLGVREVQAGLSNSAGDELTFSLPAAQGADFPVGLYQVYARLIRPGETKPRETNRLALLLVPEIQLLPVSVTRNAAGTASIDLEFTPELRAGQTVSLILSSREIAAPPFSAPTHELTFVVHDAPVGSHLARLRIDGTESLIIDRTQTPPVFLDKRIEIT